MIGGFGGVERDDDEVHDTGGDVGDCVDGDANIADGEDGGNDVGSFGGGFVSDVLTIMEIVGVMLISIIDVCWIY